MRPDTQDAMGPATAQLAMILATRLAEMPREEAMEALGMDSDALDGAIAGGLAGMGFDAILMALPRVGYGVDIDVRPAPRSRPGGGRCFVRMA